MGRKGRPGVEKIKDPTHRKYSSAKMTRTADFATFNIPGIL
jgi:hypothetical protein